VACPGQTLSSGYSRADVAYLEPPVPVETGSEESDIFGLPNGLGLGFGCRSKPKPTDQLASPFVGLACSDLGLDWGVDQS
jgi:hypothetical protein